jgi:hypothetical protein
MECCHTHILISLFEINLHVTNLWSNDFIDNVTLGNSCTEPDDSFLCSKEQNTAPHHKSKEFSPHFILHLFKISYKFVLCMLLNLPGYFLPLDFATNLFILFVHLDEQFRFHNCKSARDLQKYEVPHYTVFCTSHTFVCFISSILLSSLFQKQLRSVVFLQTERYTHILVKFILYDFRYNLM